MAKVKAVRQRCIELNDSVKGETNGLKLCMVKSGRLKFCSSSGKLQIIKDQPCTASTYQVQNADNSQSKKQSRKESCDFLVAVVTTANYAAPSRISQTEISARNALVNMRLRDNQLCAVDVCGDNNFFLLVANMYECYREQPQSVAKEHYVIYDQ